MSQISDRGRDFLVNGTPLGVPDDHNPFVCEGGQWYLRYDKVTVGPLEVGGAMVTLSWRGDAMWYMRREAPGISIEGGFLEILGLEGRMAITLSA